MECFYGIDLGKVSYFTNLNLAAIWGWFPMISLIKTMIPGCGGWNVSMESMECHGDSQPDLPPRWSSLTGIVDGKIHQRHVHTWAIFWTESSAKKRRKSKKMHLCSSIPLEFLWCPMISWPINMKSEIISTPRPIIFSTSSSRYCHDRYHHLDMIYQWYVYIWYIYIHNIIKFEICPSSSVGTWYMAS